MYLSMFNMASFVLRVGTEPTQPQRLRQSICYRCLFMYLYQWVTERACWCRGLPNRSCNAEKSCFPHIFLGQPEHKPLLLSSHDRCVMLSPHRDHGNQAEQNNIQTGWTVSSSCLSGNQAFYFLVHDDPSGETIIANAQFYPKSCTGWSLL